MKLVLWFLFVLLSSAQSERISARKCAEYQKSAMTNTRKCSFTKASYGSDRNLANPKEFPHMALLGYQTDDSDAVEYQCGGVLISESFVLTAAHCVLKNLKYVLLGEYNVERDDDDAQPLRIKVIERIVHESFSRHGRYDNIALLKLERNVEFTDYIRPACLPESVNDSADNNVVATGWGVVNFADRVRSAILKRIVLEIVGHDECNDAYKDVSSSRALKKGIIDSTQLCTSSRFEAGTCQGDSGGPVQIYHPTLECMYTILGIISFGKSCDDHHTPGVNTRLYAYLDWIEGHVWPSE